MLIISKFPKSIAVRTKCPRGRHAACAFEAPAFIIDIYLLRLSMHCAGSITIMWSVEVFINYSLTFRQKTVLSSSRSPTCTNRLKTGPGNVENIQLRFGSPLREPILTLLHPCLGFNQYVGNHWARSTNTGVLKLLVLWSP